MSFEENPDFAPSRNPKARQKITIKNKAETNETENRKTVGEKSTEPKIGSVKRVTKLTWRNVIEESWGRRPKKENCIFC